jgi:hypothetical protein
MMMIIEFTLAIVTNPFINILLFIHHLLKIAFTGVWAVSVGNDRLENDWRLCRRSAELLTILCDRGEVAFPSKRTAVANRLIAALFDPTQSLPAQLGAIAGIRALGSLAVSAVTPHIPAYVAAITHDHNMLFPAVQELFEMAGQTGKPPDAPDPVVAPIDDSSIVC